MEDFYIEVECITQSWKDAPGYWHLLSISGNYVGNSTVCRLTDMQWPYSKEIILKEVSYPGIPTKKILEKFIKKGVNVASLPDEIATIWHGKGGIKNDFLAILRSSYC